MPATETPSPRERGKGAAWIKPTLSDTFAQANGLIPRPWHNFYVPAFSIKPLRPGDAAIAAYRELRIQLWPDCSADCDREIREIIADPARWAVFLGFIENDRAAGFLELRLRDCAEGATSSPVAYIEGWFVAVEYRRRGLGKALVDAAENWALARGCREIASDTQPENRVSIAAHEHLGYKPVERLVCFLKQLKS